MNFQKYFEAFPYSGYFMGEDGKNFFFLKDLQQGKYLHRLLLDQGQPLLEQAEIIYDQDLNSRSFRPLRYDATSEVLYVIADENHDEKYNLWKLDLKTGALEKLTHVDFAAGGLLTKNFRYFYYGDRKIQPDRTFETTFKRLDLQTFETKTYFSDAGKPYRMSWGRACILKDSNFVIMPLNFENLRNRANLAAVDLSTGDYRLLLPVEQENSGVAPAWESEWDEKVYFYSEHTGHQNLFSYDLHSDKITQLSDFHRMNHGLTLTENQGSLSLAGVFPLPEEGCSVVRVLDLETNQLRENSFPESCYLIPSDTELWIASTQISDLPRRKRLDWNSLRSNLEIVAACGNKEELVHSKHRFLKYDSFDGLEIPAYLAIPTKVPVKAAIVRAFYGGSDYYHFADQILLEQGIAVLSPAVRGSWGWGKAWVDLLKGDLGGKEIIDVIWGAKFLERELGLPPSRIGIEGGSHGGYAVLRALTMPVGFEGLIEKYPWGFGLCWAGFADLIQFHKDSWIADWLVDLLGPIEENRDLYRERSPLTHFHELVTPLFIVHGTHDRRVPPSTMEAFINKLQSSEKPHQIHFVHGQGHTGGDKRDKILQYTAQQEFLSKFLWNKIESTKQAISTDPTF